MNFPAGTRVYIDANLWIYLLNPPEDIAKSLKRVFDQVAEGRLVPVTSVLSWFECLVMPLRLKDEEEKALFDQMFTKTRGLELLEVTRDVLFVAAELRAAVQMKTPDAIHLASAKAAKCDVFLTHDSDLRRESLREAMTPIVLQGLR